jgi:hypothetical protein
MDRMGSSRSGPRLDQSEGLWQYDPGAEEGGWIRSSFHPFARQEHGSRPRVQTVHLAVDRKGGRTQGEQGLVKVDQGFRRGM